MAPPSKTEQPTYVDAMRQIEADIAEAKMAPASNLDLLAAMEAIVLGELQRLYAPQSQGAPGPGGPPGMPGMPGMPPGGMPAGMGPVPGGGGPPPGVQALPPMDDIRRMLAGTQ